MRSKKTAPPTVGNWWLSRRSIDEKPANKKRIPCPLCGKLVLPPRMGTHAGSKTCKNRVEETWLLETGYVQVQSVSPRWRSLIKELDLFLEDRKQPWINQWLDIVINTVGTGVPIPFDIVPPIVETIKNDVVLQGLIVRLAYERIKGRTNIKLTICKRTHRTLLILLHPQKLIRQQLLNEHSLYRFVPALNRHIEDMIFDKEELYYLNIVVERLDEILFSPKTDILRNTVKNLEEVTYGKNR